MCWKQEKKGKLKNQGNFDNGHIVMVRQLGQSIS